MRAAVMEAVRKPLVVKEVPDPKCPPDGVIIRAEAEGVSVGKVIERVRESVR